MITKINIEADLAKYIFQDLSKYKLTMGLLLLNVILALAVVHWAQLNRQMVIQQDVLLQQRDDIDLRWRHLLLEQRALAEHSRVEQIARERLAMGRPTTEAEVVVTLP
ncbi:cell division protein FtsL [Psychrosphaera sp. B3R10]|uniref:cell division protein FtsL n=1 Tax=unclassified Psychrosphaera TaxID=2641570 RepID=UPI001C084D1B|nr:MULTISPECIES: cell division protein FtsL [unclassified Psychrosphaera]MBU2880463.1 cell division protein FtsL [Psychrosphaera sp. I2R16]MBU2991436.1 cell division protein FtsL [Psychrosphaera sp. B3R10]